MQVRIYIDSFLVSCFWLHFLCLVLCGAVILPVKNRNLLGIWVAAFLCSCADAAELLLIRQSLLYIRILWVTAELLLAVRISFGKTEIIRNTFLLLLTTSLFGGVFTMLRIRNTGFFCFFGSILVLGCKAVLAKVRRRNSEEELLYEASLDYDGESRSFTAFLDTGNRLHLYGSSEPVMVAKENCIEDWVRKSRIFHPQKYICLPFCGVGGKGLLFGVRVECRITNEKGKVLYQGKAAVVSSETRLFRNRDYELLLQPEFFKN